MLQTKAAFPEDIFKPFPIQSFKVLVRTLSDSLNLIVSAETSGVLIP